jgi:transposase
MARKQLQAKMRDIELRLRGLLRGFCLKVGEISKGQFAARVGTLTAGHEMLEKIAEAMLRARHALQMEFTRLHRAMLAIARKNEVCRRLMSVPGVGALIAVTFMSAVDNPGRFSRSRAVGAHFGLTPKKYQSGERDITGAVSRVGDPMVRTALYEGAHILLTRAVRFSALKRWALEVAKRRVMRRAKVALARKLAVILHRMWVDGTTFRWIREGATA